MDDIKFWIANETYPPYEIAIGFKHRIESIHCFANGNGRHSRLIADVIIEYVFNEPVYSWGSSKLVRTNDARKKYLFAIKKADRGIFNH